MQICDHTRNITPSNTLLAPPLNYRPVVQRYGLWDQLRVDHGKEWTLMLFAQEQMAHLRGNCSRAPHLQTSSKQVRLVAS